MSAADPNVWLRKARNDRRAPEVLSASHGLERDPLLDPATVLTTLVGRTRYPDDGTVDPTEADAKESTAAAARIRTVVMAHFASLPQ